MSNNIVFFSNGPMEVLLALNTWAVPFRDNLIQLAIASRRRRLNQGDGAFVTVRREAARRKLLGDVSAWNSWADNMLALESKARNHDVLGAVWRLLAETDLRDEYFQDRLNGGTRTFPGVVDFSGARFGQDAYFNHARFVGPVDFSTAKFAQCANFEGSIFEKTANFSNVHCLGRTEFRNSIFKEVCTFEAAEFVGDVWFRQSSFAGQALFRSAQFAAEAGLGSSTFKASADFSAVHFSDNAGFDKAIFEDEVTFDDSRFQCTAWFSGAQFRKAASFDRARFLGRMHFEDVELGEPQSLAARQFKEFIRRAAG